MFLIKKKCSNLKKIDRNNKRIFIRIIIIIFFLMGSVGRFVWFVTRKSIFSLNP